MARPRRTLDELPLVLAGPIVRRVERERVAVWIALKEPVRVRLDVFAEEDKARTLLTGTTATVRVGAHLHVAVVVAAGKPLAPGGVYPYDLTFTTGGKARTLGAADVLTVGTADLGQITIPHRELPSFALPAATRDELRIVHGSCRKPHAPGTDALAELADMIEQSYDNVRPAIRPQQLLLTGDQIYAEDVGGSMLAMIVELADLLFDTPTARDREPLPDGGAGGRRVAAGGRELAFYRRSAYLGDTFRARHQNADMWCHLLRFAEFAAMYLLVWNDRIWPVDAEGRPRLPAWEDAPQIFDPGAKWVAEREPGFYADELDSLREFHRKLADVRRALANVATYMMIDDHEITDDCFFEHAWVQRNLLDHGTQAKVGRTVVRNALAAYAIFQGWGNDPDRFAVPGPGGRTLLDAIATWDGGVKSTSPRAGDEVSEWVGMPPLRRPWIAGAGGDQLAAAPHALHWHFVVPATCHVVIALDTRTRRVFPRASAPTALMSTQDIHAMFVLLAIVRPRGPTGLAIVISPAAVVEDVRYQQSREIASHGPEWFRYEMDVEPWIRNRPAMHALLDALWTAAPAVVVTGDVHYGGAYGARAAGSSAWVPMFVSSPLCNRFSGLKRDFLREGRRPIADQIQRLLGDDYESFHSGRISLDDALADLRFYEDDAGGWVAAHTLVRVTRGTWQPFRTEFRIPIQQP